MRKSMVAMALLSSLAMFMSMPAMAGEMMDGGAMHKSDAMGDSMMMKKDDGMMKKGDAMKGDKMMKKDDGMMKKNDGMDHGSMMKGDDSMHHDDMK